MYYVYPCAVFYFTYFVCTLLTTAQNNYDDDDSDDKHYGNDADDELSSDYQKIKLFYHSFEMEPPAESISQPKLPHNNKKLKRDFNNYQAIFGNNAIKRKCAVPIDRVAMIQQQKIPRTILLESLLRKDVQIDVLNKKMTDLNDRLWEVFLYCKLNCINPSDVWKTNVFENGAKNQWHQTVTGPGRSAGWSRTRNVDENFWREQYWYDNDKKKKNCYEYWVSSHYDRGLGFPKELNQNQLSLIEENYENTVVSRWRGLSCYWPREMIKSQKAIYIKRGEDGHRRGDNRIKIVIKLYTMAELRNQLSKKKFIEISKKPIDFYYKNWKMKYALMIIDVHWQMYYGIPQPNTAFVNNSRRAWNFGHESESVAEAPLVAAAGHGLLFDKSEYTQILHQQITTHHHHHYRHYYHNNNHIDNNYGYHNNHRKYYRYNNNQKNQPKNNYRQNYGYNNNQQYLNEEQNQQYLNEKQNQQQPQKKQQQKQQKQYNNW